MNFSSGVFNGPQINKLIKDKKFVKLLKPTETKAWKCCVDVIQNFLGNKRADNYKVLVKRMISAFGAMGVNMSLKIHFLDDHLDFFPSSLGDFSDEHGERFHQGIATIETRHKGKDIRHMLGEYCWSLYRDTSTESFNRKNKRPKLK